MQGLVAAVCISVILIYLAWISGLTKPPPTAFDHSASGQSASGGTPTHASSSDEGATSSPTAGVANPDTDTDTDCKKLKCVALTYDDGPDPDGATQLAATLRQQNAKATFFMLGQNVQAYPEAVKHIADTGSEIGNHSWRYSSLTAVSTGQVRREL